ncbi:LytTR family DNA-binding domain-containing protein [Pediococcus stilesii]|uniref:Response regulator n=1 Tax=Pediococcus stilesii TaxID=331679 RepID=A0A0R2KUG3_9LACO|nr:LytTR family DNA-binding domain-containing protein [Pediococcus stilesii]KRN93113.1 response regulator [Pediococcus stilesii]
MKVRVEINQEFKDGEVIIRAPEYTSDIQEIKNLIERQNATQKVMAFYQDSTEFYLEVGDILFFETEDRQVLSHTGSDMYTTHSRLYELEEQLPVQFVRISKSCIVNVTKILALTKSLSNCLIQFQNTHKQVYASRRYYKPLQEKLKKLR